MTTGAGGRSRRKQLFGTFARFDTLLLAAAIWFLAKFLRYAFPPLFDEFEKAYSVSVAELGTAFTGFMLVYAAMQFPSGLLADRFGGVRVITAGALTAAAGALVVPFGGPFLALVAAMLVMGAGTGAHKTVAIDLLAKTYPDRTGRALGVLDTFGTTSGVLAPLLVAVAVGGGIVAGGWRTIFLLAAVVGIVLAVVFAVRVDDPQRSSADDPESASLSLWAYLTPFAAPRLAAFVVVTLGFSFAYNGLVAFLPLYLSREIGLSTTTASLLYSLFFAVSLVQLASGEASDRVGRLPVLSLTLSVAALGLGVLVVWGPAASGAAGAVAMFAVVAMGLGSHGFRPVRGAHLTALLPERVAGGGLGVVRTGLMGAGAVAPAIVGWVADATGSFRPAFALLLGALVVSAALTVTLLVTDH